MNKPGVHDFTVKHGGKGYKFEVYVNTNEDPKEIIMRLQKAARGQVKAACMITVGELTPEQVSAFLEIMSKMASNPNAQPFDLGEP